MQLNNLGGPDFGREGLNTKILDLIKGKVSSKVVFILFTFSLIVGTGCAAKKYDSNNLDTISEKLTFLNNKIVSLDTKSIELFQSWEKMYQLSIKLDDDILKEIFANQIVWFTVNDLGQQVSFSEVEKYLPILEETHSEGLGKFNIYDTLMRYYNLSGNIKKAKKYAKEAIIIIENGSTGLLDINIIEDTHKTAIKILNN